MNTARSICGQRSATDIRSGPARCLSPGPKPSHDDAADGADAAPTCRFRSHHLCVVSGFAARRLNQPATPTRPAVKVTLGAPVPNPKFAYAAIVSVLVGVAVIAGCAGNSATSKSSGVTLRLGYLTRITHASAWSASKRAFTKNLGAGVDS